jgi:hypothetical protein
VHEFFRSSASFALRNRCRTATPHRHIESQRPTLIGGSPRNPPGRPVPECPTPLKTASPPRAAIPRSIPSFAKRESTTPHGVGTQFMADVLRYSGGNRRFQVLRLARWECQQLRRVPRRFRSCIDRRRTGGSVIEVSARSVRCHRRTRRPVQRRDALQWRRRDQRLLPAAFRFASRGVLSFLCPIRPGRLANASRSKDAAGPEASGAPVHSVSREN